MKTDMNPLKMMINTKNGTGEICRYDITELFSISYIDLALSSCAMKDYREERHANWISVQYCISGRCEMKIPGGQTLMLKSGDCMVGTISSLPDESKYPLQHFKGIELSFSPDMIRKNEFQILKENNFSIQSWLIVLSASPVIFEKKTLIKNIFSSFKDVLSPVNPLICKLKLMEVLAAIDHYDIQSADLSASITDAQIAIAKSVYALLKETPEDEPELEDLAARYKISVSSLNNYFHAVYGEYVPTYMRSCRLEHSASLLKDTNEAIYKIALRVGYANASKYSAAFQKAYGCLPSEYRRRNRV